MNYRNSILLVAIMISFNIFAQERKESKTFDVVIETDERKSNQFVLDFLRTDSRIRSHQLRKLIDHQMRTNSSNFETANTRKLKRFGKPSPTITKIFLDNEVVLGEGINRLYLLDQMRMKEVSRVLRTQPSYDNEIYIYRVKQI
ncbi:hypothetical protein SAMN04489761_4204 [Tenacibaculum sp. MAR_2009_124]|uniref:hypothetical protein n=1 Tax=Tenacibaculum sp. MAR_2009_124 TaxID=1250059 RepID=UPI000897D17B|nr:hypothetical protein [Tenacibaculum sp. MAR_2009_124]SED07929.1 hypothetical protein SAMN04489761_4204 [Tenacibaculum sp. MAR_2009_124]